MGGGVDALVEDWGWVEPVDASQPVTISPQEWRLVAACHGPTSPTQLATRCGMTPDEVRRTVASLAARGLVRAEATTSTRGANGHGSLFAPPAATRTLAPAAASLPTRTHVLPDLGGAATGPEPLVFDPADEVDPAPSAEPAAPLVFAPPGGDLEPARPEAPRPAPAPIASPAAKVPAPLSGAKASPFERRMAKLERRGLLLEDELDAEEDDREPETGRARRDSSSVVLRMVRSFGDQSGRS